MYQGVLVAGFGGQGVISAGILMAYSGMMEDKHVTFFPSYGAEMRGGTANCSVVISSDEVSSPVVSKPDTLIVMNEPSLMAFEKNVKPGGLMLVNSSLITAKATRDDIEVVYVPVNDIASEVGSPKSANMVMIGAFCEKTGMMNIESVIESVPKVFKKANEEVVAKNADAIRKGAEAVK